MTLIKHYDKREHNRATITIYKIIDLKTNDWTRLIKISEYKGTYDEIKNARSTNNLRCKNHRGKMKLHHRGLNTG